MSTSSAYSSNKLTQVIQNNTEHFIIRSYITTIFDYDRKKDEYHLYWYNKNKGIDSNDFYYKNLSYKRMNPKEIKTFNSIRSEYNLELDNEDGCVWHHKKIGFNKERVKVNPQLDLPI